MWWPTWRPGWWPTTADRSDRAVPPGTLALGSGRTGAAGVAPKAALLDGAARAGLPVPAGFVLPDGRPAPDRSSVEAWASRTGVARLAVRSAFGAEDDATTSLAGWFDSFLHVEPGSVPEVADQVRRSAERHDGSFRRDVLIMAMVDARLAGVAFSEPGSR